MMGDQCPRCKHYTKDLKCRAFPKGIPLEILQGLLDHTKKIKGDQGIRFEAVTE